MHTSYHNSHATNIVFTDSSKKYLHIIYITYVKCEQCGCKVLNGVSHYQPK